MNKELLKASRGIEKADLVLKNCKYVDVFNGSFEYGDIAIKDGIIIGMGSYQGIKEIDMTNKTITPGFIDGHVHIESSMLTPTEFSKIILPFGTTTIIADPHEIGNVSGVEGIKYMLESSKLTPLDVHIMIPSCVPATSFETAGAVITSKDINKLKDVEGILGLGEVMDYPSVIHGDDEMHKKLDVMKEYMKDGHSPEITGKDLNAYVLSGIKSDHECTTRKELEEKVRLGMYIHLREGSATRNVTALCKGVTKDNSRRLIFCTDDKHPVDIKNEGHINFNIKLAIKSGVDFITAVRMATLNTSECYNLKDIGAIAPNYKADLVVVDDEKNVTVSMVIKEGKVIFEDNTLLVDVKPYINTYVTNSIHIDDVIDLDLELKSDTVKVIQLIENNVTTKKVIRTVTVKNGIYVNNPKVDILKLAVIERHKKTGNIGLGLVEGYGMKNGAVAMTIAHDSHNLICLGDNDESMKLAVEEIIKINGGIVLVKANKVVSSLSLEVAGLMTNQDVSIVEDKLNYMEKVIRDMGLNDKVDDPFLSCAFLSLPVIPELKVTDMGLFDVTQFRLVEIEE